MKYYEKLMYKRLLSGFLTIVLVVASVISPLNIQTTYATNRDVQLNYDYHSKKDVEIYVQSESVNYNAGDAMLLDLYVQNNSEEALTGIGLSWSGNEDAFEEAEFILQENCDDAEINEKGIVTNLNLEPGEVCSLQFAGILADDLEDLECEELVFFYGSKNESGTEVTGRAEYAFTVGLFGNLEVEFVDGAEIEPGETKTANIKMSLNEISYYNESEDEDGNATSGETKVATDSDSDEPVDVVTDSNTEESVFGVTGVTFNLDTYGIKLENVTLTNTEVEEGNAAITTTVSYEAAEDAEPGTYFGTLQAVVSSGKKTYHAEVGMQVEVMEAEEAEEGHILECEEECSGQDCECGCHETQKALIAQVAALLAEVQTYDEETEWDTMYDAYDALYGAIPDAIEAAYDEGKLTDAEFGYLDEMFAFYGEQILVTLAELGFDPYDARTLDLMKTYNDEEMADKFYWRLDAGYIDKNTGETIIKHDEEACNAFAEQNANLNDLASKVTVTYGPEAALSPLPYGGYEIVNSSYLHKSKNKDIWYLPSTTETNTDVQNYVTNSILNPTMSPMVSVLKTDGEARDLENKNSIIRITTERGYIVTSYRICCEYALGNYSVTDEFNLYGEKCKTVNVNTRMLVEGTAENSYSDFYINPSEYQDKASSYFYTTDGFFQHKSEIYQGNPQAKAIGHHYVLLLTVEKIEMPQTGTLTVEKIIKGLTQTEAQNLINQMEVTVGNQGSKKVADLVAVDGGYKATVTYTNVPAGTYTVTENNYDVSGYKHLSGSSTVRADVTVAAGGTATATLTNVYEKVTTLSVTKVAANVPSGDKYQNKTYTFRVLVGSSETPLANTAYTVGGKEKITGSDGSFVLTNGQTAIFTDMLSNTSSGSYKYRVQEWTKDDSNRGWYDVSYEVGTGTSVNSEKTGLLDAKNNQVVTFTNTYKPAQITVKKIIEGLPENEAEDLIYTMTVKPTGEVAKNVGNLSNKGNNYEATVTYSVDAGTYVVNEYDYIVDGYDHLSSSVTTDSVTVTPGGSGTATLKNIYDLRTLEIKKTVTGTVPTGESPEYEFTVKNGSANGTFQYKISGSGVTVNGTPVTYVNANTVHTGAFDGEGKAVIKLKMTGGTIPSVTMIKIPNDAEYAVAETGYIDDPITKEVYSSKLTDIKKNETSTDSDESKATDTVWENPAWTATNNDPTIEFINDFNQVFTDVVIRKQVTNEAGQNLGKHFMIQVKSKTNSGANAGTYVDTTAILTHGETSAAIRLERPTTLVVTETQLKEFDLATQSPIVVKKTPKGGSGATDVAVTKNGDSYEFTIEPGYDVTITVKNTYSPSPYFHDDFGKMNDFGKNNVPKNPTTTTTAMAIETRFMGGSRKEEDLTQSDETLLA